PSLAPVSCNAAPPASIYTLSLHDALPISPDADTVAALCLLATRGGLGEHYGLTRAGLGLQPMVVACRCALRPTQGTHAHAATVADRKSTRLNSSHVKISYAVFCLKKKKRY